MPTRHRDVMVSSPSRRSLVFPAVCLAVLTCTPGGIAAAEDPADAGAIPMLVKTRVPLTPELVAEIGGHGTRVTSVWPQIDALAVRVNPARLADLAAHPLVALVEPDLQGQVTTETPIPATLATAPLTAVPVFQGGATPALTWNHDMANVIGTGFDGSGVTVAVVDSGLPQNWREFLPPDSVDVTHAAGFGAEGWGDFHNPVNAVRGAGGHIGLLPHGLAVSSVIVGFPSDFGPIGGAAPGATILPIRCLNQFNFGWFSWFTAAILHVGDLKARGDIPGPLVINFSIQARGDSVVLADAIRYAIGQGVLFVTIAGNFGPGPETIAFPGRMPESIAAGAVGWMGEGSSPDWFLGDGVPEDDPSQVYVAPFSGRESWPPSGPGLIDVLAPGSFVFGEWLFGPGFSEGRQVAYDPVSNFIFGTSFAAPHVAGIVAQMLEKAPGLTQAEAEAILRTTALPIPPDPDGASTTFWAGIDPWFEDATGAGLARGDEAVAATPAP